MPQNRWTYTYISSRDCEFFWGYEKLFRKFPCFFFFKLNYVQKDKLFEHLYIPQEFYQIIREILCDWMGQF